MSVSGPSSSYPNSPTDTGTTRRWRPRRRWAAILVAIALLGCGVALVGGVVVVRTIFWVGVRHVGQLEGHFEGVWGIAFSPDGAYLASASDDETARIWSVPDRSLVHILPHQGWVTSVAFSPDGRTLATGYKQVDLWSVEDGRRLRMLEGHPYGVWSVAFSPDGTLLASSGCTQVREQDSLCSQGAVWLWSVADGRLLHTLPHESVVFSVAFAPDGQTLASGACLAIQNDRQCAEGRTYLWRVSDGTLLHSLAAHQGGVSSVTFSPDGALVASGASDGSLRLWHTSDGILFEEFRPFAGHVRSVAFTPDGEIVATGANNLGDGAIHLWRVADGRFPRQIKGIKGVDSLAFSPDGLVMAAGTSDGTIHLWRLRY